MSQLSKPIHSSNPSLSQYGWLSIAAACLTMALKGLAYWLTNSVGILSDALESSVNLSGALVLLLILRLARQPPDAEHPFGHDKAEYFSSGLTGGLIIIAAIGILSTALPRLALPQMPSALPIGYLLIGATALINYLVARILSRAAQQHRSVALEGDARHLLTDVVTTVSIIGGLLLAQYSGWPLIDPLIALVVAAHVAYEGWHLLHQALNGLMDRALPDAELACIERILDEYRAQDIDFHALRTRASGRRRFITLHVLVPGVWSVKRGHDLLEELEARLRHALPGSIIFTHLEPIEDPSAWADKQLDRV